MQAEGDESVVKEGGVRCVSGMRFWVDEGQHVIDGVYEGERANGVVASSV